MLITNNKNWKHDDGAMLGVQTGAENVLPEAIRKAHGWRPRKAKSFSMSIQHTDYHGNWKDAPTGYATIFVRYYTRANEGLVKIDQTTYKLSHND